LAGMQSPINQYYFEGALRKLQLCQWNWQFKYKRK